MIMHSEYKYLVPKASGDVQLLLQILPSGLQEAIAGLKDGSELIEIVLDLGRKPEIRTAAGFQDLDLPVVERKDLQEVVARIGTFTADNRAGIERTLHRISAIRNRTGDVVGLTCRVGRAVYGTIDIVQDVIESGLSLLLLGRPGVGKTTLLREAARVLADDLGKRVVIVDTSNEIGGDGDIPHPGVGRARRMQVPSPDRQHAVMIEAVENHMPEVIVIDEIGTQAEAEAARTIAERGVQLIATAHGKNLDNLLQNPTLTDLVGGIQAVTLSDEEARRRGTQKTVLERKGPPTFQVLVEIQDREQLAVYREVAVVVDGFLNGLPLGPEIRKRSSDGQVQVAQKQSMSELPPMTQLEESFADKDLPRHRPVRIFTYGVNRDRLEKALRKLKIPAQVIKDVEEADLILSHKGHQRRQPKRLRDLQSGGIPLYVVKSNTIPQIELVLQKIFGRYEEQPEEKAILEAEDAVHMAMKTGQLQELGPRNAYIRSLQHQIAKRNGLRSESKGQEPYRQVLVLPW
ncbi:MAG: R3H domain-containing nucleic acid-binding protein [Desulfovermiculus sp.]